MGIIVPAILPVSYADLDEKLTQLSGLADEVQVDIVDGVYASPASWPYNTDVSEPSRMLAEGRMIPHAGDFHLEIDLMSADPESAAGSWIELGATRLTVHAESTRYISRFLTSAAELYGHDAEFTPGLLSLGLAIGADTDLALIEPYLSQVEYVQFMGIKSIGKQGQAFASGVLPKIAAFRKKYPKIPIQVDGGVTLQNAPKLLQAGVSRLVVGSALWRAPDLKVALKQFEALTEEFGIYG